MNTQEEANQTCEQRIDAQLAERIASIEAAFEVEQILGDLSVDNVDDARRAILEDRRLGIIDNDNARDKWDFLNSSDGETQEDIRNNVLSVDKMPVQYRVQLSWGGPSDEFIVTIEEGEITQIEYVFLDWFDGARRRLSGDDFEAVKFFLEGFWFEELQ